MSLSFSTTLRRWSLLLHDDHGDDGEDKLRKCRIYKINDINAMIYY